MRLRDIITLLEGRSVFPEANLDLDITSACGADLMSDVLAFVHSGSLLLTGLTNPHVIRTAEVVEVAAIVLVRGKIPPKETTDLAREKGIPIILTPHTLFECSGRLYKAGVESCDVQGEARQHADELVHHYLQDSSCLAPQGG
ncbi:MAG: DRTGG domain-containing protein [Dehalococcoidales bacterium]|nr:DRTGG domain-containing protein [Dehalococcoidales bacterium]